MDGIAAQNTPYQLTGSGNGQPSWDQSIYLNYSTIFNPLATINQTTIFILTVTNSEGCVDVDSVKIEAMKGPDVYIPLAFTPNGDGLNDKLKIISNAGISALTSFKIFSRSGNLVFESRDLSIGWDGRFNGNMLPSDIYYWTAVYVDRNNQTNSKTGTVLLLK
jgi:gliding motility-associated-like protein